jgi:hypothetical protein
MYGAGIVQSRPHRRARLRHSYVAGQKVSLHFKVLWLVTALHGSPCHSGPAGEDQAHFLFRRQVRKTVMTKPLKALEFYQVQAIELASLEN